MPPSPLSPRLTDDSDHPTHQDNLDQGFARSAQVCATGGGAGTLSHSATRAASQGGRLVVFQEIEAKEWEDFTIRNHCEVIELAGRLNFSKDPVIVGIESGRLRVWYRPGIWSVGAPDRRGKNHNVFNLEPGQWGRLIFNGRFGGGGFYHRQVFSIACSLDLPADDCFAAKPDFAFSDEQGLR